MMKVDGVLVSLGQTDDPLARGTRRIWCMPVLDAQKYIMHQAIGSIRERTGEGRFKHVGALMMLSMTGSKDANR